MPKNNNIEHQPLHTTRKFGKRHDIRFLDQLANIKVNIIGAPSVEEFRKIISVFMMNTWNDRLKLDGFDDADIDQCIKDLFAGEILPTGMETINITWSVEGLDMIDTTHLIRHRLFSFSAQTHADRDMRNDNVMVKPSIMYSKFFERYMALMHDAAMLYTDMMDSGIINCLDARTVMPRCFEHFYITRSTIKDLISFCQMRGDEQIQTQSDNIIAMKLWLEILKIYPFLKGLVDFRKQDAFYVRQCKAGKTNIFPPNEKNDCFEWHEDQFFHGKPRDAFSAGWRYLEIREELLMQIDEI